MNIVKLTEIICRGLTAPIRVMPDFLIIGAQKCGTTSLYTYLEQHPCVIRAFRKELNFFDLGFQRSILWYRGYFPTLLYKQYIEKVNRQNAITGEATPQYLFHPLAPERVAATLPNIKLIVLLRNPVDRAYSHYNHEKVRGRESLSFEDAINLEKKRLSSELEKILEYKNYKCHIYLRFPYLSRGIYMDQLQNWMRFFPREELLIFKYEDLVAEPPAVFKQTLNFLGLQSWELKNYKASNVGKYSSGLEPALRNRLIDYFEPHNERLYKYLDIDFGWR